MGWTTRGKVNVALNSAVVTGVGSLFLQDGRIGDGFRGPDGRIYEVTNIATNTGLTIQPPYEGPTVSDAAYYLAPFEGYVKDTADALRAASLEIGQFPLTKQDKSDNLTAFSGLTGVADRMPYFTGAGALSLAVLTAKARLLLARADSAGMRSEISAAQSGANSDITSLAGLTTPLSVAQGGLGVTSVPAVFTRLRDSQALSSAEAAVERLRMKTFEPIGYVVDIDDASTSQVRGPGYVTNTTIGTKPHGFAYGILNTIMITGDVLSQTFEPLVGSAGTTFPLFRRTGYGVTAGRWGPWRMVIDSDSALNDPDIGGLMSSTVVSGFRVDKYANGSMCVTGKVKLPSIPANEYPYQTLNLPVTFLNTANMQPSLTARGLSSADMFGVTFQIASSTTSVTYAVRNGGTAQGFEVNVTIWGTWK